MQKIHTVLPLLLQVIKITHLWRLPARSLDFASTNRQPPKWLLAGPLPPQTSSKGTILLLPSGTLLMQTLAKWTIPFCPRKDLEPTQTQIVFSCGVVLVLPSLPPSLERDLLPHYVYVESHKNQRQLRMTLPSSLETSMSSLITVSRRLLNLPLPTESWDSPLASRGTSSTPTQSTREPSQAWLSRLPPSLPSSSATSEQAESLTTYDQV